MCQNMLLKGQTPSKLAMLYICHIRSAMNPVHILPCVYHPGQSTKNIIPPSNDPVTLCIKLSMLKVQCLQNRTINYVQRHFQRELGVCAEHKN